ncbi:MAG: 5'-3' exonuclease [Actinomycetota bacterium]|nr:5'-3' exonuclease [Actinomycetota bacterium]
MADANEKLLLVDAPSAYFRAFHGVPESVTAPDGTPVNAVRGFLDVLARQIRDLRPDRFVAAFDYDWRPAFRVAALPSYKAHRVGADGGDQTPPGLVPQVPILEAALDAVGLARVGLDGYEADDVIGTMATCHEGLVDVLTGDRDLFQLIRDDKPVRVVYSVEKFAAVDEAAVTRKYDIPGRGYAEFAILRGDPSDGLPGVPGIGAKTASALVTRFGTVEAMLAALDAGEQDGFPAGARAKLAAARDYLAVAPAVVYVVRDLALPAYDDRLPTAPADPAALVELSDRWNLDGPLNRLLAALATVAAGE